MLHTMQHGLKLINRCSIVVVQPQILASRKNHFAPLVFFFATNDVLWTDSIRSIINQVGKARSPQFRRSAKGRTDRTASQ